MKQTGINLRSPGLPKRLFTFSWQGNWRFRLFLRSLTQFHVCTSDWRSKYPKGGCWQLAFMRPQWVKFENSGGLLVEPNLQRRPWDWVTSNKFKHTLTVKVCGDLVLLGRTNGRDRWSCLHFPRKLCSKCLNNQRADRPCFKSQVLWNFT